MSYGKNRRRGAVVCGVLVAAVIAVGAGVWPAYAASAHVRVNQVGYLTTGSKQAVLMASEAERDATFKVVRVGGGVVYSRPVGSPSSHGWNNVYDKLYVLDFSAVTTPGTYSIHVSGPVPATSPQFRIATGAALYAQLLTDQLFFFQTQRDGTNVKAAVMHRQPAHRTDAAAFTYAPPHYNDDGVLQGPLKRLGKATRDVAGGWFDAGDYLKFTHTTAYVLAGMLLGRRDYPGVPAGFAAEARFGLRWLMQMWDDDQRVLYYQVGIGEGNGDTILGDHDFWRLPEKDDQRSIDVNDTDHPAYYVKFRPVLRANAPGQRLTPNLAGRIAAALALCYQVYQHSHPQFAETCLTYADHLYNQADTTPAAIFAASPTAFYPEDEWHSDLELGAVELYLAITARGSAAGLSHSANAYLRQAAHWARQYIDNVQRRFAQRLRRQRPGAL